MRKLTPREVSHVYYAINRWRSPRRHEFLREILETGTTIIQTGPRGGKKWGRCGLDTRSYESVRRALAWRRIVFVQDFATGKVHIRKDE